MSDKTDLLAAAEQAELIRQTTDHQDPATVEDNLKSLAGLGVAVRHWRTLRGWSLTHVASVAQVSEATLSKLERGEHSPTMSTLTAVANALNVDVTVLMVDARRADADEGVLA